MMKQFNTSLTENFFQELTTNVFDKYDITDEIHEGEFGPIYKVKPKDPSATIRVYSLKTMHLNRMSRQDNLQQDIVNEINALTALDHPNIIKLFEVFYNDDDAHIISEYTNGDDLYSRSPYSERDAARISSQLASALAHMHESGVIHCDLKFESIVFENSGSRAAIKVTDFGVAKRVQSGRNSSINNDSGVGTIYTMAPEVLKGIYTEKADCWSMGVIMFMLLSSEIPFYAKRSKNMVAQIEKAKYKFSGEGWNNVSDGAKHLVANLLLVDSDRRYTAQQALDHLWIRKWIEHAETAPPGKEMLQAVDDSLLQYRHTSTLKKLALNLIAHKSTTQEIIALRNVFDTIDKSHNGTVDHDEFREGLKRSRFSDEELDQIFESIDVDKSGQIQYTEFLAATLEARGYLEEERIAEAFESIDRDGSGFIDKNELQEVLGKSCTVEQIDDIIRAADTNNDGRISYEEFFDVFRDQTMIMAAQVGDFTEPTEAYDSDEFDDFDFGFDPNADL